jgi:acetylornithine/succinyldiaminopimelate/putrescine aminotransferase
MNGQIYRDYVGGGAMGELAARLDAIEREERLLKAASIREAKAEMDKFDELLTQFETLAETIGRGLLIAAGYHQHNRSEWRKRNERT